MDRKQYDREYYLRNRQAKLDKAKEYRQTDSGKASRAKYRSSPKGQDANSRGVRKWRQAVLSALQELKMGRGCMNTTCPCSGIPLFPCDLDFHHLSGKLMEIPKLVRWAGIDRIQAELARCVVVCTLCHKRFHADVAPINLPTDYPPLALSGK